MAPLACMLALALVGTASAASQATLVWFQAANCSTSNHNSSSTVKLNPGVCQLNSDSTSYIVNCNGGGSGEASGSASFCEDSACKQCTNALMFQNDKCMNIDASRGVPGNVQSAKLTCPSGSSSGGSSGGGSSGAGAAAVAVAAGLLSVAAAAAVVLRRPPWRERPRVWSR